MDGPGEASSALRIANGLVLRHAEAQPERLDIRIDGGRIAELIDPDTLLLPGERVFDAARTLVMPGLVNAHYHSHDVLARGCFEDIPLETWIALAILPPGGSTGPRVARLRTLIGAIENLRNGTTTVQDMLGCGPGSEAIVEATRAAYEEVGMRCVLGLQVGNRAAIDCLPGIREVLPPTLQPLLSPPQAAVADILAFVDAGLATATTPRLHWAIAPGSPQRCSFDLLSGLGEIARQHGLPVVTHVNESKLQVFLARELYGGSVLDYLEATGLLDTRLVLAHGVWLDDFEIERIAAAGASIATNPASNLKLKNGIAPHDRLVEAGVRLAIGCDNASAGDTQNLFEAMRLLGHLNSGRGPGPSRLDARRILGMATRVGAEALGLGSEIGSIAPGACADLAFIDLTDPAWLLVNDVPRQIAYAEGGRAVRHVMVEGRFVVLDRRLETVDPDALAAEAADLAAEIRRDYRDHFERMAPVAAVISAHVRSIAERRLPFSCWPDSAGRLP